MEGSIPQTAAESLPPRTFRALPGRGKAAVLIIWISTALGALLFAIAIGGFLTSSPLEREQEMDAETAGLLVIMALALAFGVFQVVLSFLLIRGKNWARIVLIVLNALHIVGLVLASVTQSLAGSDCRNAIVGTVMLFLLTHVSVKDWCTYVPGTTNGGPPRQSRMLR